METNVYEKLGLVILDLQNTKLKKSGENKFSKYNYFELGDFLPTINDLNNKHRIKAVFNFGFVKSVLTIVNLDNIEEKIVFESRHEKADLKGCQPIQNLGAEQTYMRRYLYVMAYEIIENDIVETQTGKPSQPTSEQLDNMVLKGLEKTNKLRYDKAQRLYMHNKEKFSIKVLANLIKNNSDQNVDKLLNEAIAEIEEKK